MELRKSGLLINLAAVVVILGGLKLAGPVVVPVLVSAFLAMIAAPLVFWLEGRRMPAVMAVLVVVGLIVALATGISMVLAGSIDGFLQALPTYQDRVRGEVVGLIPYLNDFGLEVDRAALQDLINPGAAMGLVSNLLNSLGGLLTQSFLILLLVVFILLEASGLPSKLRMALKTPEETLGNFSELTSKVNNYLLIKTGVSLCTGVAASTLCLFMGVDFPLVMGLLAFLLNYIPSIGSIIAAIPAVVLALVELGFGSALVVTAGYFAINVVFGNIVEPRFQGKGAGLSTFVVFFSLVFWGWLLGTVGMLLSVPLTMTLKIVLAGREDTRWISVLLGPSPERDKDVA